MVRNFKGVVKVTDVQEEFDNLLNSINDKIDTYNSSLNIEDVDYNIGGEDLAAYGYTLSVGGLKKVLDAYDGAILGANVLRISNNQYIVSEGLYIKDRTVTKLPSKVLTGNGESVYFDSSSNSYTFTGERPAPVEADEIWASPVAANDSSDMSELGSISFYNTYPNSAQFNLPTTTPGRMFVHNSTPHYYAYQLSTADHTDAGFGIEIILNELTTITNLTYTISYTLAANPTFPYGLVQSIVRFYDENDTFINSFYPVNEFYLSGQSTRNVALACNCNNVKKIKIEINAAPNIDNNNRYGVGLGQIKIVGSRTASSTSEEFEAYYGLPYIEGSDTSSFGTVGEYSTDGTIINEAGSYHSYNSFRNNTGDYLQISNGNKVQLPITLNEPLDKMYAISARFRLKERGTSLAGRVFRCITRNRIADMSLGLMEFKFPSDGSTSITFDYGYCSYYNVSAAIGMSSLILEIYDKNGDALDFDVSVDRVNIIGSRLSSGGSGGETIGNILISPINSNRISKLCNRPNATNEEIPGYKMTIESKNSGYTINGNQYLNNSDKGQFYSGSAGRNCAINLFGTQVAYHQWHGDRSDSYHEPLNFMFIPKGIPNPYSGLSGEIRFAMQKVWNYILKRPER